MATLSANATLEEIEEELAFTEVLISSLDTGDDEYFQKLSELEVSRSELERRVEAVQSQRQPQPSTTITPNQSKSGGNNMNGSFGSSHGGGYGGSQNSYSVRYPRLPSPQPGGAWYAPANSFKRARPSAFDTEDDYPSKRQTPEPSAQNTPSSSTTDSLEMMDQPSVDLVQQANRQRQRDLHAAFQKRHESVKADEEFARSLSQGIQNMASSSRPSVQTTLNGKGSYSKPPPAISPPSRLLPLPNSMESRHITSQAPSIGRSPYPDPRKYAPQINTAGNYIKPEPAMRSPAHRDTLVQRPRQNPDIIDLTNSDDDDDGLTEIAPRGFTPSSRTQNRLPQMHSNLSRAAYGQTGITNVPYAGYGYPNAPGPLPSISSLTRSSIPPGSSMPGAYPTPMGNGNQYVYQRPPHAQSRFLPASQLHHLNNGLNYANTAFQNVMSEVGNLFGVRNPRPDYRPRSPDADDDDVQFLSSRNAGTRPGYGGAGPYSHLENDFTSDPTKTHEEINALVENIRPDEEIPANSRVQTPEQMTIRLHKYQELGLTWLQGCEDGSNKGGVLADDMGLGKTIQMLSLIVTRQSEDPRKKTTLIVAPVALMRQWSQEIEQKIKRQYKLTVFIQHGPSKKKDFRELQHYDIVLTTFGSLAAELKKLESYHLRKKTFPESRPNSTEKCALISDEAEWYRVILDEAQCIKNNNTKTAKAACHLKATYRFCMTGTPMMNNVDEFYSLIRFLRIRPYSDWTKFRLDISAPLKQSRDYGKERAMYKLQALCKAVMLRRTKKSTFEGRPILILPERTGETHNPTFSDDEQAFYNSVEADAQLVFNRYLRAGTVGSNYSVILVKLLRLRQACCHPHLIQDFGIAVAAGVTPADLVQIAKELAPDVIARVKETDGSFECPVCYDGVENPAIFHPCGHATCRECFARIADPANALRDGNENPTGAKCPTCRGAVDPKRITDFESFKRVHMPEKLAPEERTGISDAEVANEDSDDSSDSDTESEDDDEVDGQGNLRDFIVNDDETEEEDGDEQEDDMPGPSKKLAESEKKSSKKPKKPKKGKGSKGKKKEKKIPKNVTLAELKKLATRSKKARAAYIRRLSEDYISSAKIEQTMELLKEIMNVPTPEGERVLVFSQWTSLLDLLEVPVSREQWGYRRYDGSMNAEQRNNAVDDFREPRKNVRIMLVSLKAGNAGLNLNMASRVIILDPFWNPYIEEQAIDRAHRLGQTRPVKVHHILIENTVEDRIIELQNKKRELISQALDEKAGQNIARLGVQELAYLFGVTRNAAAREQYQPRER